MKKSSFVIAALIAMGCSSPLNGTAHSESTTTAPATTIPPPTTEPPPTTLPPTTLPPLDACEVSNVFWAFSDALLDLQDQNEGFYMTHDFKSALPLGDGSGCVVDIEVYPIDHPSSKYYGNMVICISEESSSYVWSTDGAAMISDLFESCNLLLEGGDL